MTAELEGLLGGNSSEDERFEALALEQLGKLHFARRSLVEANFVESDLAEASFEACEVAGMRFERCDLRGASFADCSDLLPDPARDQVRGARIPFDSAVRLAESLGFSVIGFSEDEKKNRRG